MRSPATAWHRFGLWTACCGIAATLIAPGLPAQNSPHERVFPQTKAAVERILRTMAPNLAGRLPVLDGFAEPTEHPLDRYERGYYQATVQVMPTSTGGSRVRVSVKVTAWYSDRAALHSGYELLMSNGRLEEDVLDQVAEQLGNGSAGAESARNGSVNTGSMGNGAATSGPTEQLSQSSVVSTPVVSTPKPRETSPAEPGISAPSAVSEADEFSASSAADLAAAEQASARVPGNPAGSNAGQAKAEKAQKALQTEAESLQEIVKNQGHPKNLVAVRKSGTPIVATPSLTAKPLFLASMHDEFEMLDFNPDWVHVRISGLSRGWIWRNGVEMPDGIPDTATQAGPTLAAAADLYHVVREETAPFPGDWAPLRGKTVKILSVQKVDDNAKDGGAVARLAYAKYLLDKSYAEMANKTQALTGIVLIFDSVDGGMIAATMSTLQQWKAGSLSDSALWHKCFFDPPETFDTAGPSGTQ